MSFLRKLFLLILVILLALILSFFQILLEKPELTLPSAVPTVSASQMKELKVVVNGDERRLNIGGLAEENPDCSTSFIRSGGILTVFMAAENFSATLRGSDLFHLNKTSIPLRPDGRSLNGMVAGYKGFCSVILLPDGRLLAFYQEEFRRSVEEASAFAAQIGLAISSDGGMNFQDVGPVIISSRMWDRANRSISGVGQPSAILIGNTVYVYFIDWDVNLDAIHLATANVQDIEDPSKWARSTVGPVVIPGEADRYTALPGVMYDPLSGQYLMTYETAVAFKLAVSPDGIHWTEHSTLLPFGYDKTQSTTSQPWYGYPSVVCQDAPTQALRGNDCFLIYAKKLPGQIHLAHARTIRFS